MDIITTTVQSTQRTATAAPTNSADDLLASDYETFLTMLATQMKNQDPLNPVEGTDFATQLAQFSALEQQVRTNDLLSNLGGLMAISGLSQLSGWVGMEARTIAPVEFQGTPVTLIPTPARLADQTFLVVKDGHGDVVQRSEIPVSAEPVEWAGVDETGNPFPSGQYSFELESMAEGVLINTAPVENYTRIVEAQQIDGQTVLVLQGGARVISEAITALRNPA